MNLLSRNTVQQIDWKQWHPMSNGGQPSHLVRHRKIQLRSKFSSLDPEMVIELFVEWMPIAQHGPTPVVSNYSVVNGKLQY
jgi:hypothetical protein